MKHGTPNPSNGVSEAVHPKKSSEQILALVLLMVLLAIFWFVVRINRQANGLIPITGFSLAGIGILVCLQTILIERLLNLIKVGNQSRNRMAFLTSCVIGWLFYSTWSLPGEAIRGSISGVILAVFLTVWILLFAFLGGLITTSFREGVVENNYPPTDEVARQVYLQHESWMQKPQKTNRSKRSFDIFMSLIGLCLSSPVWLLSGLLIWLEDPGPLLFVKNSVGKGGKNFRQYKFRTMIRGAEESTGPILSTYGDQRVLFSGKFLRKTALDELPQLVNILKGEMSFVGPRPQRTVMVNEYLKDTPEYADRHRVLPGLAGLAQVVGHYYLTPRQKLRFDRIYIQHANLGFDLLLICLAFLVTFGYRWKKDWNGRLPRRLLHGKARG